VIDGTDALPFDLEDDVVTSVLQHLGLEGGAPHESAPRPADPAAADKYQLALRYLTRHDHEASVDGAIRLLEALSESEGARVEHVAMLGRAFLAKWRLTHEARWESRAAQACARAMKMDSEAPSSLLLVGEIHESAGRIEAAREAFQSALRSQPDALEVRIELVRLLYLQEHWSEAETECEEITRRWPGDWRGFSLLGRVRMRRGRYSSSLPALERVVALVPDSARGLRNLGTALYHLDRFEDAANAYQRALAIEPDAIAYHNLGTVLFHLDRFGPAIEWLERAVALRPSDPYMWGSLGNACRWIPGRERRMQEALERAVVLMRDQLAGHPDDAEGRARLAGWLMNLDRHAEGLEEIRRVLTLAPENVECMARAGYVYADAGDHPTAIHWFRQAVQRGYGTRELERSPVLANLRAEPEFLRVIEEGRTSRGSTG